MCLPPSAPSDRIQLPPFLIPASFSRNDIGTPTHSLHDMRPCVSPTFLPFGVGRLPSHSTK